MSRAILIACVLIPLIAIVLLYCIYKPPGLLIRYCQRRWPDVLFHVPTEKKIVALTIDDAPSTYTPAILRLLQAHNATATFFVIGTQVPGLEPVLADLVRAGNELGNHAMYDEPSRLLSNDLLEDQMRQVHGQIQEAYSTAGSQWRKWLFRPGGGVFSSRMRQLVNRLGYRLVLGNVYPHDPQVPFWRLNAGHVLSMVKPGSIIVCHDRRGWTVPMLQKVLPELTRRGYDVVAVSELLKETD
jgi:peptidoglycan/xylan/chitin deacetylase (PgdA/CDA1 family)